MENPQVPEYQKELGTGLMNYGYLLERAGRAAESMPLYNEARDLYERLGLPFGEQASAAIVGATSPQDSRRVNPWGRVGLSKTAFQPMDSRANAWAWRQRLSHDEQEEIIERTADVASLFYSGDELAVTDEVTAP